MAGQYGVYKVSCISLHAVVQYIICTLIIFCGVKLSCFCVSAAISKGFDWMGACSHMWLVSCILIKLQKCQRSQNDNLDLTNQHYICAGYHSVMLLKKWQTHKIVCGTCLTLQQHNVFNVTAFASRIKMLLNIRSPHLVISMKALHFIHRSLYHITLLPTVKIKSEKSVLHEIKNAKVTKH